MTSLRACIIACALAAAISLSSGCGSTPHRAAPAASISRPASTPTPSTTVTPIDRIQEVRRAYLHAWDIRAEAFRRLDTSHLHEVLTGAVLTRTIRDVNQARARHQPVAVTATHDVKILKIDDRTFSVDDQYIIREVPLDPNTLQPTSAGTRKAEHKSFTMKLENGTWKISFIVGYS